MGGEQIINQAHYNSDTPDQDCARKPLHDKLTCGEFFRSDKHKRYSFRHEGQKWHNAYK